MLCVFAKPPRPGEVKTRLASTLGADAAATLARAFFADTRRVASSLVLRRREIDAPETERALEAIAIGKGPA
jgi:glycosyltransferase A (GT-A) superfamily protein (DUF2064 family)